jgi:hypothetical protein
MWIARALAVLMLSLALAHYALAQDSYRIVSDYADRWAGDRGALMAAGTPREAAAAAEKFAIRTDKTFQELAKKRLLDKKLGAYQTHWGLLKPVFEANPRDEMTLTKLDGFSAQFVKAAMGGNCTIVISASAGEGAIVHDAKAHDADLGRAYKELPGTTTIIYELERAEYKFKSFRGKKETGRTDIVACTDSKTPVRVVINE